MVGQLSAVTTLLADPTTGDRAKTVGMGILGIIVIIAVVVGGAILLATAPEVAAALIGLSLLVAVIGYIAAGPGAVMWTAICIAVVLFFLMLFGAGFG
jgi:hypothetical protein